ncbi:hypothetical protein COO60DRAFT_1074422 [Scenedesmus sp. NREL 46B-D3]|nr:hypothetical protein COO60DRAFT_1074422 [Scenedesmus sp. NREL 46B-D3]
MHAPLLFVILLAAATASSRHVNMACSIKAKWPANILPMLPFTHMLAQVLASFIQRCLPNLLPTHSHKQLVQLQACSTQPLPSQDDNDRTNHRAECCT